MNARRGFSLVELMVASAIFSVLLGLAAPSFSVWISNGKIRSAAESLQNGLQLARSEAVGRNALIRFQLTDTIDDSCLLSASGPHWFVSPVSVVGKCAALATTIPPEVIQIRNGAEGSGSSIIVTADQPSINFSGLGRQLPVAPAVTPVTTAISVTHANGGTCLADGGALRCLRVVVSYSGQIRMCDPALPAGNTQGC